MKSPLQLLILVLSAEAMISRASAAAETYVIDPVHSSVGFTVRHFVGKVSGKFNQFDGTLLIDRDHPAQNAAMATIQVSSVDTNSQKRDDHLRSVDFFDASRFPQMKFKSKAWKKTGAETFDVVGDLTIKDVTKEIVLKVSLLGFTTGDNNVQLSGWEATARINKKEFNVKDPPLLDVAIGDDVTITINVEARKS